MVASVNGSIQQLRIEKEVVIAAPVDIAFEAMLEEVAAENKLPDGTPMPLVLEAFPGGRWFRDLGDNTGHLWGHVQVIKPPKLIEISGPLFMSFPCANHVQYRFSADGIGTRLSFLHRAFGEFPEDLLQQIGIGWTHIMERIKSHAESR